MVRTDHEDGSREHKDRSILGQEEGFSIYGAQVLVENGARLDRGSIIYEEDEYDDPTNALVDIVTEEGVLDEENARSLASGELNEEILEYAETLGLDAEFWVSLDEGVDYNDSGVESGDPMTDGGEPMENEEVTFEEAGEYVIKRKVDAEETISLLGGN